MLKVAPNTDSRQTGSSQPNKYLVIDNPTLLERTILESTPLARAMDLTVLEYDGSRLALNAPLSSNVNDKGCAFGGSLASMMTLASWGLVWLQIEAAGLHADVFVADSQIRYLAPLFADLHVEAELAPDADWPSFIARLRERGRARASLLAHARLPGGGNAAEFTARYVAIAKP